MKKIKATIEIECGSDFQHDVIEQFLTVMLEALANQWQQQHKKNKVEVKIDGYEK